MKQNIPRSNSESDSEDPDEPDPENGTESSADSSSEDDKKEETTPKFDQTTLRNHSQLPSNNGDVSDSETDIDKPPKSTDVHTRKMSLPATQSLSREISSAEEESGEESEEQLSMSLLQRSVPKQKSPPKKESTSSSTNISNISRMSKGSDKLVRVERAPPAPEMSPSESDSSEEDRPLIERLNQSQTPSTPAPQTANNVEEHYTHLSATPLHIPEDSSVWVLQIPYNIPASHLVGQKFPTKLRGGEVIEVPSFPLQLREQPCAPSNTSLYCIKSVGDFSYDMQLIRPRGFWTLRRPSFSVEPPTKALRWGVPIAPIPVEELLKYKSKVAKKHLSPQKHRVSASSGEIHRAKGRKSEVISTSKEEKKKLHHDQSSDAKNISAISFDDENISPKKNKKKKKTSLDQSDFVGNSSFVNNDDASMLSKKMKKKKKTSLDQSDIVENSSFAELSTMQGKKRKHSTSHIEEGSSPSKKKRKPNMESEPHSEIYHALFDNLMESLETEQNLGEKQKKQHKKRKHKSTDSFEETNSFLAAVKIEENAMQNYENLLEESSSPKKKKRKKDNPGGPSDLSVSVKVELSDDGHDEGSVLKNPKKKKHIRKHRSSEGKDL